MKVWYFILINRGSIIFTSSFLLSLSLVILSMFLGSKGQWNAHYSGILVKKYDTCETVRDFMIVRPCRSSLASSVLTLDVLGIILWGIITKWFMFLFLCMLFFAKECILLHASMTWRVYFEWRFEDLAFHWPRKLVADIVLALSWIFLSCLFMAR